MHRLEKEWRKNEQRVFNAIQKYSGVKWTTKEHTCYVVGAADPFSDPMTISVFASHVPMDYVSDVLCHELIHRNFEEQTFVKRYARILNKLKKKYPQDTENTLDHVIVHAIHEQIFLSVFSKNRLLREKRVMSPHPDYDRAWKIVENVGSDKIIEMYLR
ncbi:hypothetical protein KKD88_03790 [Patescibacteria group bacterium]|nr:hypothetical protein [Patescibacteria group bacterium]